MNNDMRLKYFPVSFFSIIMGLTGYTIALQKAEGIFLNGLDVSRYLLYVVALILLVITGIYLIKLLRFYPAVKEELNNPVRLSFFPTFTISLLLLSIAFLEVNVPASRYLWVVGATLHLAATLAILSAWIRQTKFEINHFNPAWFIPVVGNILVPIAGVRHTNVEVSWFFFSIGIVFWILLFAIMLYRLFFHHPLPQKLFPTFFILIAPPAVGFISYLKLNGGVDNFAKILYYFALFLVLFLFVQVRMFIGIKFYLSWWAYSFPIAAITIASAAMYAQTGMDAYRYIFMLLFAFLSALIVILIINTLNSIRNGEICVKEE